jgi:tRNA (guanine37-N1)-methyltransferase
MRIDVFTLFPEMFVSPFAESIVRRAMNAGLLSLHTHNIRDYATDKHKITDDLSFGGGGGMVLKPDPIFYAVEHVLGASAEALAAAEPRIPILLMSPSGQRFTHAIAQELATHPRIALICGHYEGVDDRVRAHLCTGELSIGDYVLTGGELPAMVIADAVARLIPGTLPPGVPEEESHAMGQLEYPHYTRPAEFRGMRVPDVLLSGNHAAIAKWRAEQAAAKTARRAQDNA